MIHQQQYIKELFKKFGMDSSKPIDTPISPSTKLVMDDGSPSVEEKLYSGMIRSLLYLTASRPDIVFSVGLCARFKSKCNNATFQTPNQELKMTLLNFYYIDFTDLSVK